MIEATLIAVLCCAVAFAALSAASKLRSASDARLEAVVGSRVRSHGIWTGVWLLSAPAAALRALTEADDGSLDEPGAVLRGWASVGARIVGHVEGPPVITEAEARGWLTHAADDLSSAPLQSRVVSRSHGVVAIVYASAAPPPVDVTTIPGLSDFLCEEHTFAVVFVTCHVQPGGSRHRAARAAAWAVALVALLSALACVYQAYSCADASHPGPAASCGDHHARAADVNTHSDPPKHPTGQVTPPPRSSATATNPRDASSAREARISPHDAGMGADSGNTRD